MYVFSVQRPLDGEESHQSRAPSHASGPDADHKITDFEPEAVIRIRLWGNVHEGVLYVEGM